MGTSNSVYSNEKKHMIILSIPTYADKIIKTYKDIFLSEEKKYITICKYIKELYDINIGMFSGFDEQYITGITIGLLTYIQTLDNRDEDFSNNLIRYMIKLLETIDKNIIEG